MSGLDQRGDFRSAGASVSLLGVLVYKASGVSMWFSLGAGGWELGAKSKEHESGGRFGVSSWRHRNLPESLTFLDSASRAGIRRQLGT